jgi:hypothetical protein
MLRQYLLPFCIGSLLIPLTRLVATPLSDSAPASPTEHGRFFLPITDTTYHLFPVSENTYGYNILINNKVLIHQPAIPGVPGNKSFASLADAEKVAKLAIRKIKQGLVPPTIKKRELDSLKIKYRL